MRIVVLDFETFYSDDFTLSKMSTEAYIRDPRFEAHGAAIKWQANIPAKWYDERQLRWVLQNEDWSDTLLISHHAQFDHLILSHHYAVHPKMSGCTLSMARLLLGNHIGVSLDSVREQFGLPKKITPYNLFKGKHWNEISAEHQQLVAEGACDEVESVWKLFGMLLQKGFPRSELEIVDATIKMFTEPCLRADMDLLGRIWKKENDDKQRRLAALGVDPKELSSSDKFAELLRAEGVEPQTKISPSNPDKQIWAFAKTDQFMQDLLEDEDERIRTLAEARLGIKSTLLQTRAETIGFMARRGPLCIYLRMYGAHTTRWSGGDGCLTGDTQILTLDIHGTPTYKNIVDVLLTDLVWDGEEFVEHEGVAFTGYKEVISWDGVNGTPEHEVFCKKEVKSLSEALRTKTPILDCREPTAWEVESARSRKRTRT